METHKYTIKRNKSRQDRTKTHTYTHTQPGGAPSRVLYNVTPDISSDFMHLEAGQLSHLFNRAKIAASFNAVYYY